MRVELTAEELSTLTSALDSHMYWQLSESAYRRDGGVVEPGSDDREVAEEIARAQKLHDKLYAKIPCKIVKNHTYQVKCHSIDECGDLVEDTEGAIEFDAPTDLVIVQGSPLEVLKHDNGRRVCLQVNVHQIRDSEGFAYGDFSIIELPRDGLHLVVFLHADDDLWYKQEWLITLKE